MAISSKHKLYGGVLGVGLIALVTDKAFLAPADAAANDPVVAEYAAPQQASVLASARSELDLLAPQAADRAHSAGNIIGQLKRITEAQGLDLDNINDAFEPSKAWQTTSDNEVIQASTTADGPSSRFRSNHRLLAVMGSGDDVSVIINKDCLDIGDEIDGFTLVSVDDRGNNRIAVLEYNGMRVQLKLELLPKDAVPSGNK